MEILVLKTNPRTRKSEWKIEHQGEESIINAQYVDMLNDKERNEKYFAALKKVVKPNDIVLDIGTGTGILGIMSTFCGSKRVYGCEVYNPMAKVAEKVVKENGLEKIFKIIPKRSTDMNIIEMDNQKATILVTEILDSELLGEGIIPSISHAVQNLLEPSHHIIPCRAIIYGQVYQSNSLKNFHTLKKEVLGASFGNGRSCPGYPSPFEIQFDSIAEDNLISLTEPFPIFDISFITTSSKSNQISVPFIRNGTATLLVTWWKLFLDDEIYISTAPKKYENSNQWRNHWKQCVYFLKNEINLTKGNHIYIQAARDDFSLWFNFSYEPINFEPEIPNCSCGMHLLCRSGRISMLNDEDRWKSYIEVIKNISERATKNDEKLICLHLGDNPFLISFASQFTNIQVYILETSISSREITKKLVENNHLDNLTILSKGVDELNLEDFGNKKIDLIIGEPFYYSTQECEEWLNLAFWYEVSITKQYMSDSASITPQGASIWGMAVEFENFHQQYSQVEVEGINMEYVNKLIRKNKPLTTHYLWMYNYTPLSEPVKLIQFDFRDSIHSKETTVKTNLDPTKSSCKLHAIILWVNYHLNDDLTITNFPTNNNTPTWKKHSFYMFETYETINGKALSLNTKFDGEEGTVNFNFNLE